MGDLQSVKNGQAVVVMEVVEDPTYTSKPLEHDGEFIPISKAHVWITAPWLAADANRETIREWQMSRFWFDPFQRNQKQIVLDGCSGPNGHGSTYDPFWVGNKGRDNDFLKLEVKSMVRDRRGRPIQPREYTVDKKATDLLLDRRDAHLRVLQASQDVQLPTLFSPKLWASVNKDDLLKLNINVPAFMAAAHLASKKLDEYYVGFDKTLADPNVDADRLARTKRYMRNHPKIVLAAADDPEDTLGWTTALHNSTAKGWHDFWMGEAPGAADGHYSEIDGIVAQLLKQLAAPRGEVCFVPLEALNTTEHVTNVFLEKMKPRAFRLDRSPKSYHHLTFEPSLEVCENRIRETWNDRVNTIAAAEGCSKKEAAIIHTETSKKSLQDRLEDLRIKKKHSSALVFETRICRMQLWYVKRRANVNRAIKKFLGIQELQSRYSEPHMDQSVRGGAGEAAALLAEVSNVRGGLD